MRPVGESTVRVQEPPAFVTVVPSDVEPLNSSTVEAACAVPVNVTNRVLLQL